MLKTLGAHIKEFKKDSLLTPFFMILEVIMEMIIPLMMSSIIDDGVNAGNAKHIYVTGACMVVVAFISLWSGAMGGKYGARASTGFARNLRKAMYENIQSFSFSNIDKFSTAGLVTRMTTDVTNIQNAYQMLLRMCVRSPISLICAMFMAFFISPKLACVYLVAVIVLGIILAFITVSAHRYFTQAFPKYDDLNASVQENVSAIRVVKAYVREDYEKKKFTTASQNIYNMFVKAERILAWNNPVMQLTVYSCILAISWLGAQMIVGSSLTTGELMSLLTYCMNIMMSLMMLSMVFVMLTMSVASAERICEVLNEKSDITNPEQPVYEVADGSIEFSHVTFRYNKTSAKPVLDDVTLSIKSGETIGIIGGTGSSKSSLVNLISRLYDVSEGSVSVGGKDVRSYSQEELTAMFGVVFQNDFLYADSIEENIRFGREISTDEIVAAAKIAQAHDFISSFADGYAHGVSAGGTNLSGGQRQRVLISRAIAGRPEILILDDSSSALDYKTDANLRRALAEALPESTVITVAQRVSSVKNCDHILVIEDGAIIGSGKHEELLQSCAEYKEISDSQMGGAFLD